MNSTLPGDVRPTTSGPLPCNRNAAPYAVFDDADDIASTRRTEVPVVLELVGEHVRREEERPVEDQQVFAVGVVRGVGRGNT